MKHMSLSEITTACGGTYYGDKSLLSKEVSGVAIDSRKIEPDYLFIPIKGARVDGHTFIPQVMESGALCCLSETILENADHPYILVESCKAALKAIAEHYRTALGIKVVGITGSVGKTSTKEMIASVLSKKYKVLKTEGNFNNEIGLPLTIFNIREEHEIAVLEMGISNFGEMHRLAKMARPDIFVMTNIGCCHLENLGDRDGILKAKSEIFDFIKEDALIVLNGDDDKLATLTEVNGIEPLFFGLSSHEDGYATDVVSHSLKGISCNLHIAGEAFPVFIPLPGQHMVYNALAGALIGRRLGLTTDEIKSGIEALTPVSGRNNMIETDRFLLIDDCYNANPVSTRASLDVLSGADSRRVAILGDMFELGPDEAKLHYEVGVYAGEKKIDLLIGIGELSRNTVEGAKGAIEAIHFATKEDFLQKAPELLQTGDTILLKASHGMEFPELVEKLQKKDCP